MKFSLKFYYLFMSIAECTRNRFLLSEHFLYHLSDTTNHKDIFNFKCPQCEILLAKSKAGMHFMLHGLFEFHCLHCQTGLRDIGKLRAHISTRHPSKLLFATARKLRKDLSIEQVNNYLIIKSATCTNFIKIP